ncbi:hypothetical protein F4778DRAFT_275761 [Xylariomycetidae sp. FL2044]|nr:hypothetical protein F4778DRAFT_275761 [Xylariomycetidae sp. FL2044]
MSEGTDQPRGHRSHCRLSEALQEDRLEINASNTPELPHSHGDHFPVNGSFVQDATPSQSVERPLCLLSREDGSPDMGAELTQEDTQRQPLRRSARLSSRDSTSLPKSLSRRHAEADAGASAIRPRLTRETTQFEAGLEYMERVSPTPPKRKRRQIDSGDDDSEHRLRRARLTCENLAKFHKMEKEKRNASSVLSSRLTENWSVQKFTSATTSDLTTQANKNVIIPSYNSQPPANLTKIRERYDRSRGTPPPTESEFERYAKKVEGACNEATLVAETSGKLLKDYDDDGYSRVFNQAFTGFPPHENFNNGRSPPPQPDFAEGPERQEYEPFPIDNRIDGAVLYKDSPRSLTLPHLAGGWWTRRGQGKEMEEARRQSAFAGAALVYARTKALSYLGRSDPPGHAVITTFTTDGTTLNLFAHYADAASRSDGQLLYHQYPVRSINLLDSPQAFADGRRGLRNAQDHARDSACQLRDQLKEYWCEHGATTVFHPFPEGGAPPTEPDAPLGEEEEMSTDEPANPGLGGDSSQAGPSTQNSGADHWPDEFTLPLR